MNTIPPTAPQGNSPWRILILDRDPSDPKWVLAVVSITSDVRAAVLDAAGRYTDWAEVTEWVRASLGRPEVALSPVPDALAWRVDEGGTPR